MRSVRNVPRVLSFRLHDFLNTILTDDAWEIFDGVEGENGLEVWRPINLDVTQMTQSEILSLEDAVVMPQRLKSLQDIPKGVLEWDHAYRSYTEREAYHLAIVAKRAVLCASCRRPSESRPSCNSQISTTSRWRSGSGLV